MTDLEWAELIGDGPRDPARLAYADWLDEQGVLCLAAAQRLLFLCDFHRPPDDDHWVCEVAMLPGRVRDEANRFFNSTGDTRLRCPHREGIPAILTGLVCHLATSPGDLIDLGKEIFSLLEKEASA